MKDTTRTDYMERMRRILVHIQERLDEDLDLGSLAHAAHFSAWHFHRIFKGMVGETLMDHVRRMRLERACHQLTRSRLSVTDIGLSAGYETTESFSRAFRKAFSMSPSDVRAGKTPPRLSAPSGVRYDPQGPQIHFTAYQGGETMDVRIERFPDRKVAFIRHTGPYSQCAAAWAALCAWAGPAGLLAKGPMCIGLSYDDPQATPPEKLRYDACLTHADDIPTADGVGLQVIPGGDHAVVTHRGPYERMEATYAWLMGQWLPHSGREMRDEPAREIYLNDPGSTAPADLLTEICIPLK